MLSSPAGAFIPGAPLPSQRNLKAAIRKTILAARAGLDAETVGENSARIMERLTGLDAYRRSRHLLVYLSFDNEVRTDALIREALAAGKTVYVPRVDARRHRLEVVRIESLDDPAFEINRFGIREPAARNPEPASVLQFAVVPGLAFDERGGRVGFGAGYFDGLLREFGGFAVAVAFEFQVLDQVPQEDGDVPVQAIVTENRTINCRRPPS